MKSYYSESGIEIYHGDNVSVMRTMPSESVDLVVASPPYDNLRTYGGHSWDFPGVASELTRLLKPGGVIVWIVADATIDGSETGTSMRQALHFKDACGLNLHDTMIYKKAGSSPNIHHPRYGHCWEYCFVISSGTPKTFNPHKKRKNSTAGQFDRPETKTQKNGECKSFDVGNRFRPSESIECNIWEYVVGGWSEDEGVEDHPAYFPEALARDHILSWSNPDDTVLDPFVGSGTTLKMAKLAGRFGVGIEIEKRYVEIAINRLRQGVLFGAESRPA